MVYTCSSKKKRAWQTLFMDSRTHACMCFACERIYRASKKPFKSQIKERFSKHFFQLELSIEI